MQTKGVFRKTRGRDEQGRQQQSRKWYVEFRDHLDRVHRTPAFRDKPASAEYLRQLHRLVDVRTNNLALPPDLKAWLHGFTPSYLERIVNQFGLLDGQWLAASELLTVHLADYCESIETAGRTAEHVDLYRLRIKRLLAEACVKRWNQLTTEKVRRDKVTIVIGFGIEHVLATDRNTKHFIEGDCRFDIDQNFGSVLDDFGCVRCR